jgi:hypothetical protein
MDAMRVGIRDSGFRIQKPREFAGANLVFALSSPLEEGLA